MDKEAKEILEDWKPEDEEETPMLMVDVLPEPDEDEMDVTGEGA